jgi:hypothetical protein
MKQKSAKPEHSLPDLLTGSEYKAVDPDIDRTANRLGLAIAILVEAKRGNVKKDGKIKLLSAFEAECAKVENYRQKVNAFHKRHPLHLGHLNPSPNDPLKYGDRIRNWLEKALLLGNINWDELYNLIGLQIVICKEGRTDWWEAVQSVCKRVETTTDKTFSPINEIKKISEGYRQAKEAPANWESKPKKKKHGKGKLDEKIRNILKNEPALTAPEIEQKINESGECTPTSAATIRGNETWKNRKMNRKKKK